MSDHLTLGIDIGTTNVKATVLDTASNVEIAAGSEPHPLFHPKPGYAEQKANNYWDAVVSSIRQSLEDVPNPEDVASVALSGLVGVALPVSKEGNPVRQAMIWMDARADKQCQEIRDRVGEDRINYNNGNRIANWFIEPKALWMKENEPELFDKTHKFLSPAGYCTYRLSEEFSINTGDAGLFYPYDYQNEEWNSDLAEDIGVPMDKYPDLYRSYEVIGEVTKEAAKETGLEPGTLVTAGGTDISSAALGSGVTEAGVAFYSMGTGSNIGIMIPTEQRVDEYRILKWPHVIPGLTMFDAPMAFTGASLKWFRDEFGEVENLIAERANKNEFDFLTEQASEVGPGSDGLLYLPYMGNTLAPNWNSTAKGVFFGASLDKTRSHMIRAIIEGVAFDLNTNVQIAMDAGVEIDKLRLNGGPTKSDFWNQITANVTNLPLETTNIDEAAPLGDAILAAKGAGLYDSLEEPLDEIIEITGTVEPDKEVHERYQKFFNIWRRVYHNLTEEMEDLHALLN